jgi:hypothetical protein
MLAKIPLHSMKRAVSDNIQGIAVLAVNGLFVDNPIQNLSPYCNICAILLYHFFCI